MNVAGPLWLASRSPRRRHMLEQLGIDVRVQPPDFDDSELGPGRVSPQHWVMALACLKAWRVADLVRGVGDRVALWHEPWSDHGVCGTVIGADTMCVHAGRCLGQPRDAADAAAMLRALRRAEHETITGVCLISLETGMRRMFVDSTRVHIGDVSDEQIDTYITSGQWRGKAGAYNLSERIEAGWPINVVGDPTTVMGLPMQRMLAAIGSR